MLIARSDAQVGRFFQTAHARMMSHNYCMVECEHLWELGFGCAHCVIWSAWTQITWSQHVSQSEIYSKIRGNITSLFLNKILRKQISTMNWNYLLLTTHIFILSIWYKNKTVVNNFPFIHIIYLYYDYMLIDWLLYEII